MALRTVTAVVLTLACAAAADAGATYPGRDGMIAFAGTAGTGIFGDVYALQPDGSGLRNLTNLCGNESLLVSPDFGPDGRLVFVGDGGPLRQGIHLVTPGGKPRFVTHGFEPDWAPDASRLAFEDENFDIWSVAPDGSGRQNLTNTDAASGAGYEDNPVWSPDGSRIAYEGGEALLVREIRLMDADGQNRRSVTDHTASGYAEWTWDVDPDWSPDGSRIAYIHRTYGQEGGGPIRWSLHTVRPDGSGDIALTERYEGELGAPAAIDFPRGPSWSPSGRQIVFEALDEGIWVINADGSGLHQLVKTDAAPAPSAFNGSGPNWTSARNFDTPSLCPGATPPAPLKEFGKLTRRGSALTWTLRCNAPALDDGSVVNYCAGWLTIRSVRSGPRHSRAAAVLGTVKRTWKGGRTRKLVVRLSPQGKRLLIRRGRLPVKVTAKLEYTTEDRVVIHKQSRRTIFRAPRR